MMDISAFIKTGLQNTLLFKNNLGTSLEASIRRYVT